MRFKNLWVFAPALLLFAFFAVTAKAETQLRKWAHEQSDIPPSPRIVYGQLDNGLRYAVLPNQTPPGQVSVRLLVLAGSLNEQADELGYAHFVEHMVFRSTRNFPGDEKLKFLQRLGAGLGPHVNAETNFTRTLYKLDLPESSFATLTDGLRILRDFADGALFDPTELTRERGVVLSEALARRDPDRERDVARSELSFAGTLIPQRWPIGTDASIKNAPIARLRAFYDAWYRPENMAVIVAGDLDPTKLPALLETVFASLSGRGAPRSTPPLGTLSAGADPAAKFFSEARNGVQVELGTVRLEMPPPDSAHARMETLRLDVAMRMLRRRLKRLCNAPKKPIGAYTVDENFLFGHFRLLTIGTVGDTNKCPVVLTTAEQELRRALEHGFDASELAAVQEELRSQRQEEARLVTTTPTSGLANWLAEEIETERVATFPDERLQAALKNIEGLTLQDCQRALCEAWGDSPRYIFVTGFRRLLKPTTEQLRTVYQKSRDEVVTPGFALQLVKFAYDDFGPPGEVVSKEYIKDLDLWLVRFANGVRLNLKRTEFEHQRIGLNLRIGSGRLGEPAKQPGVAFFAGPATYLGGLKQFTDDELDLALNGTHVTINFTSADDAFQMSASSSVGELRMALRNVTAYLTDAAFRPDASKHLIGNRNDYYLGLEQSAAGVVAQQITGFLAGGNPRVGVPPRNVAQVHSIETIGAWLRPIFEKESIEAALVGDFDVDQAIAEFARTLGALPARSPKPDLSSRRKLQFPKPPQNKVFAYNTTTKDRPTTLSFYWPVNEPIDLIERERLQLLAIIIGDRLRVQIREAKGETYAPMAQFEWNDVYPGLANLHCQVDVRSDRAKKLGDAIRELTLSLGKQGITTEELARARALYHAETRRWQRDNAYWLFGVLADAQENPSHLENARAVEREASDATVDEINALAARVVTDKNLFQFAIKPKYHRR